MKTIYTSNYARNGGSENAFAISAGPPRWYTGDRIPALAPSWALLGAYKEGGMTPAQYREQYLEELAATKLDPKEVADALPEGAFLLCYESPTEFCHRHIVAEWLNQVEGVRVVEWMNEKELAQRRHEDHVVSLLEF
jgi:hypothetical protein